MNAIMRNFQGWFAAFAVITILLVSPATAQNADFHNAPALARELKNPYEGQQPPNAKGLFHLRCARCHGENGEGSSNIPPLKAERIKAVTAGEIFWFITKGDKENGMPSWAALPEEKRWQVVTYVKSLSHAAGPVQTKPEVASAAKVTSNAPPPTPPG